jgi:hypothetical protein
MLYKIFFFVGTILTAVHCSASAADEQMMEMSQEAGQNMAAIPCIESTTQSWPEIHHVEAMKLLMLYAADLFNKPSAVMVRNWCVEALEEELREERSKLLPAERADFDAHLELFFSGCLQRLDKQKLIKVAGIVLCGLTCAGMRWLDKRIDTRQLSQAADAQRPLNKKKSASFLQEMSALPILLAGYCGAELCMLFSASSHLKKMRTSMRKVMQEETTSLKTTEAKTALQSKMIAFALAKRPSLFIQTVNEHRLALNQQARLDFDRALEAFLARKMGQYKREKLKCIPLGIAAVLPVLVVTFLNQHLLEKESAASKALQAAQEATRKVEEAQHEAAVALENYKALVTQHHVASEERRTFEALHNKDYATEAGLIDAQDQVVSPMLDAHSLKVVDYQVRQEALALDEFNELSTHVEECLQNAEILSNKIQPVSSVARRLAFLAAGVSVFWSLGLTWCTMYHYKQAHDLQRYYTQLHRYMVKKPL